MSNIFYFIGLILFLLNISLIYQFSKVIKMKDWVTSFKMVTNRDPTKKDFKEKDYNLFLSYSMVLIMDFLWLFIGLISSEWKLCIFTILLSITFTFISTKLDILKLNFISKILNFLKLLLIVTVIGALVMNHFHFHSNLWGLIFNK